MRLNNIRLVDLLPLREEEKEDENPFAAAEKEKPSDEEGEKDSGGDEKEADDKKTAAAPASTKPKIKFNISAVKRYNSGAKFLGTEGEILLANKSGMEVNVVPDNVQIHVNFQDII